MPALCRARYTLISVGFLGQLANPLVLSLPFSCYSLSLDLATKACFWDPTGERTFLLSPLLSVWATQEKKNRQEVQRSALSEAPIAFLS